MNEADAHGYNGKTEKRRETHICTHTHTHTHTEIEIESKAEQSKAKHSKAIFNIFPPSHLRLSHEIRQRADDSGDSAVVVEEHQRSRTGNSHSNLT